jgi:uncharacterized protein
MGQSTGIAAYGRTVDDNRLTALTIDDVLQQLAEATFRLPLAAMQWSLVNWQIAGPKFVSMLEDYVNGTDRSKQTADVLFFALHLFAEKRETAAFPALCRLMQDSDGIEAILSDGITISLTRIAISTFDGQTALLKQVIEAADTDEFVRDAALGAMSYLAHTGHISHTDMRAYLLHLAAEMQPRQGSYIWSSWTIAVANLGYADLSEQVAQLFRLGFASKSIMSLSDFKLDLQRTLNDADGNAGFAFDRIEPLDDAVAELSGWYAFSEQRVKDAERRAAALISPTSTPFISRRAPLRHVGRNDPCPCGSGRKYKKCCLQ